VIFSKPHFPWVVLCWLMLSCYGMKELVLPEGLDSNFRSGEMKHQVLNAYSIQVLEYRVISDSVIKSSYNDTSLTFGIIFPRSSLMIKTAENKMNFGTDSLQCIIRYETKSLQTVSEGNSILTDIILKPPDIYDPNYYRYIDPDYDRYKKSITPYKKILAGSILYPMLKDEAYFQFEHEKAEKDFDSAGIKGYLIYGNDSFFIKPLYKEETMGRKNGKPWQVLQGYCLMKGDTLYAFLQHAPLIKTLYKTNLKDVLFINTKTSAAEQMLLAAYFSLVSRLVSTTAEKPMY
jgi:hypothetical protein